MSEDLAAHREGGGGEDLAAHRGGAGGEVHGADRRGAGGEDHGADRGGAGGEASGARRTSGAAGLLAVVDMQRVFADPGSPWATPRFDEAAAGVRRLLPAFGDRVAFTRFLAPPEPEGAWRAYYARWPFARQPPEAPLWRLTDEFAAVARHVVDAPTFGKWTPQLAALVGQDGRLVLAGVSTDCCVLSTALAAADAGVEVVVVADACAGVDDDAHAKALHVLDLYRPLVRVTTVADLLGAPSG